MTDTSIRLFVNQPLQLGISIAVADAQAHYLLRVMRVEAGDTLRLFNGVDGEFLARRGMAGRGEVTLRVEVLTRAQESEPDCWLCFALLKRQKTDLVVEKATELGVSLIQPVITARTQADHVNLDRLRAIAIEAAEQCERLAAPEIRPPIKLGALAATWPAARKLLVADERRTAGVLRPVAGPCALLIGPEGGFTEAELDGIGANPLVTRVSLGRRILRAETAAIAGLALLLAAGLPEEEQRIV
jgi:16S rRNA (uracil1498-N3)-methyltransferase